MNGETFRSICNGIGEPAWSNSSCAIYEGDCVQLMQKLPQASVSLTVTSPPYNIRKEYEQALDLYDYVEWSRVWLSRIPRITTETGAFWLNLGYTNVPLRGKAVPLPYLLWSHLPLYLIQEVIWNYGAGVAARRMFSPRNEKWLWMVKNPDDYVFNLDQVRDPNVKYPNQRKNGKLKVNPAGKNPSDVWQIPKVTTGERRTGQRASKERTAHPAQFPEAVIQRIVLASSNDLELVLDPFAGSGTTGVVALSLNRYCLLFEKDASYVQMAARRLSTMSSSERLPFESRRGGPAQISMSL